MKQAECKNEAHSMDTQRACFTRLACMCSRLVAARGQRSDYFTTVNLAMRLITFFSGT